MQNLLILLENSDLQGCPQDGAYFTLRNREVANGLREADDLSLIHGLDHFSRRCHQSNVASIDDLLPASTLHKLDRLHPADKSSFDIGLKRLASAKPLHLPDQSVDPGVLTKVVDDKTVNSRRIGRQPRDRNVVGAAQLFARMVTRQICLGFLSLFLQLFELVVAFLQPKIV